jgi:hypothetical protein
MAFRCDVRRGVALCGLRCRRCDGDDMVALLEVVSCGVVEELTKENVRNEVGDFEKTVASRRVASTARRELALARG